jgi:hypothetical protein
MKTNITLLRGSVAALQVSRANVSAQHCGSETRYRGAQVRQVRTPPALRMIWRSHAATGRLECRWAVDRGAATDEGVSCRKRLRRATEFCCPAHHALPNL